MVVEVVEWSRGVVAQGTVGIKSIFKKTMLLAALILAASIKGGLILEPQRYDTHLTAAPHHAPPIRPLLCPHP